MSRVGRLLVIDADIARSSGLASATSARRSREILAATLECRLRVAYVGRVREEWERHASAFARSWLVRMHARKLVDDRVPIRSMRGLRSRIERQADAGSRDLMKKDVHLLETAAGGDQRIVSGDRRARVQFARLAREFKPIGEVHWALFQSPGAVAWIESGAIDDRALMLGHG